jgi:hypothetical protein
MRGGTKACKHHDEHRSSFIAKRAKEADSRPNDEPDVVRNQNLQKEAQESNRDRLDDSFPVSPAARNRGESDGEVIEAQDTSLRGRVADEEEPDVIIPTPHSQHDRNRRSGKFRYPLPPRIHGKFTPPRRFKIEAKGKEIPSADQGVEEPKSLSRKDTEPVLIDPASRPNMSPQKVISRESECGKKNWPELARYLQSCV